MKHYLLSATMLLATIPLSAAPHTAQDSGTSVAFTIDQIFGSRPVVAASINGQPFRLVIHANAGSYLQINHAEAAKVGVRDLKHRGAYGISAPGQVSDLGRDDGRVDRLAIGNWRAPNIPVAVFEVPAGGSQGMLGLPFLHDNNVILDFANRTMTLPGAKPALSLESEMRGRGYSAHPLTRDSQDGRYLVDVVVNGVHAAMVVSTVAAIDLDTGYAARAGVTAGAEAGSYGGPSGATGKVYDAATPVVFRIGDWVSQPTKVTLEDTYAYSKAPRPSDPATARGGALGADFLISNAAVIDFGNGVLYLKK